MEKKSFVEGVNCGLRCDALFGVARGFEYWEPTVYLNLSTIRCYTESTGSRSDFRSFQTGGPLVLLSHMKLSRLYLLMEFTSTLLTAVTSR